MPVSENGLSSLNILLVDDEVFILNMSVRILNNLGCNNIETANNGATALDIINKSDKAFDRY